MILISMSAGLYIINRSVRDYYKYDVITNIERVTEENFLFPAIAVCTRETIGKYFRENGSFAGREHNHKDIFINFIGSFESPNGDKNLSKLEFFDNISHNLTCLKFKGGNNPMERVTNPSAHFTLTITNEYHDTDFRYSYDNRHNFAVYIDDNFVNSYLNIFPLILKRNKYHYITLEGTETENKLSEPYNDCTDSKNGTYRRLNCIEMCINKEIMINHNCYISSYYTVQGPTRCSQSQTLIDQFQLQCEHDCPMECDSIRYNLKHQDNPNEVNDSTKFHFSLNDLSKFKITQIPKMNQFLLISNIGGSLGLFIGIRFLSLIEIVEFFIDVLYLICLDF